MALGKKDGAGQGQDKPADQVRRKTPASLSPGVSDYLAGEANVFVGNLQPYLPQDIIGGSIPHIIGTEDEAVWNAASQACGTEKVHFCYSVQDDRIWYLACPSASLASNPDSWCPLAAALPGHSEHWDKETVYLYEQEGMASALRWDPETHRMQVFLGAARTILPRIQSMDANFVTVNPEVAELVPWRNRNLRMEKLSRATVKMLILSGLLVCLGAISLLILSYASINLLQRNLDQVKIETDDAALNLIMKSAAVMQSDTAKHMVRVQGLLDALAKVDGTLVIYEVNAGKVNWEALVPQAFTVEFPKAKVLGKEKDGRVRIRGR